MQTRRASELHRYTDGATSSDADIARMEWLVAFQRDTTPTASLTHHLRSVHFQDESREIASEYAGGAKRYAPFINTATPVRTENSPPTPRSNPTMSTVGSSSSSSTTTVSAAAATTSAAGSHPTTLPSLLRILPDPTHLGELPGSHDHPHGKSHNPPPQPSFTNYGAPHSGPQQENPRPPSRASNHSSPAARETRRYLDNPEETLFMQVFVEEVGIWMDSFDPLKHVCCSSCVIHCDGNRD